MKKSILLILLLSPILLFPQEMSKEAQEFKTIVMKYAYQYLAPMHIKVLEHHNSYSGPESYKEYRNGEYVPWDKKVSNAIVLEEITVVIHESTHGFEIGYLITSPPYGRINRFIVSPNKYVEVKETEVIRTSVIASEMIQRNDVVKEIGAFNTYVNLDYSDNMSSNLNGIYGLMNEYCAYYNGASSAYILYSEFKKEEKLAINDSISEWYKDRKEDLGFDAFSQMSAFYKFNSFIAAYLIYVQENNPNIYNKIMNNTELLRAYAIVTNNYQKLAEEIQNEFPENEMPNGKVVYSMNRYFQKYILVYNDYIPFLEELRNLANNQLLTKK